MWIYIYTYNMLYIYYIYIHYIYTLYIYTHTIYIYIYTLYIYIIYTIYIHYIYIHTLYIYIYTLYIYIIYTIYIHIHIHYIYIHIHYIYMYTYYIILYSIYLFNPLQEGSQALKSTDFGPSQAEVPSLWDHQHGHDLYRLQPRCECLASEPPLLGAPWGSWSFQSGWRAEPRDLSSFVALWPFVGAISFQMQSLGTPTTEPCGWGGFISGFLFCTVMLPAAASVI